MRSPLWGDDAVELMTMTFFVRRRLAIAVCKFDALCNARLLHPHRYFI